MERWRSTPLIAALGSGSKLRLLRALLAHRRPRAVRELARLIGMSLPPVLRALRELEALGFVTIASTSAQFLCEFNQHHQLVPALDALFAAGQSWRDLVFTSLQAAMHEVNGAQHHRIVAAWIFGSMARGDATATSDLDLFLLTTSADAADALRDALAEQSAAWHTTLGVHVQPIVLADAQAWQQRSRRSAFLHNVLRDGRLLLGVPRPRWRSLAPAASVTA